MLEEHNYIHLFYKYLVHSKGAPDTQEPLAILAFVPRIRPSPCVCMIKMVLTQSLQSKKNPLELLKLWKPEEGQRQINGQFTCVRGKTIMLWL